MNRFSSGRSAGSCPLTAQSAAVPVPPAADEPALDHVCFLNREKDASQFIALPERRRCAP